VLTRARARAAAVPEREELAAQAHAHEQRAGALADRERELVEADEQRAAWHAATEPAREQARWVVPGVGRSSGVGANAVVAPVARQVGDQAQVILFAGCHTAGILCARRGQSAASRPLTALLGAPPDAGMGIRSSPYRPPAWGNAA